MVGGGPVLADELISAKRGIDYMITDLQNKNVLLHKIETTTVNVDTSTSALVFDGTISDVLAASIVTSSTYINMERDGFQRWAEIPTKGQPGRPTRFWWDRRRDGNIMNLWPIPDQSYTVYCTIQKNAEDTVRAFDNIDVPRRFMPAIIYGLAYWIGLRRGPRVPDTRLQLLRTEYERAIKDAMREDRERGKVLIRVGRR